jgi:hypothetical protein
MPRKRG